MSGPTRGGLLSAYYVRTHPWGFTQYLLYVRTHSWGFTHIYSMSGPTRGGLLSATLCSNPPMGVYYMSGPTHGGLLSATLCSNAPMGVYYMSGSTRGGLLGTTLCPDCHYRNTMLDYTCMSSHRSQSYYDDMCPEDENSVPLRLRGKRDIVFGNLLEIYKFHDR